MTSWISWNPKTDTYFVVPQSGPSAFAYGSVARPSCYTGDCVALNGDRGPFFRGNVRERLRDFYAHGVQGGTCNPDSIDVQNTSGLFPPFATHAVNYFGCQSRIQQQERDESVSLRSGTECPKHEPDSYAEASGYYVTNPFQQECQTRLQTRDALKQEPQQLPYIMPLPGDPSVKTLSQCVFPGIGTVKTCHM